VPYGNGIVYYPGPECRRYGGNHQRCGYLTRNPGRNVRCPLLYQIH